MIIRERWSDQIFVIKEIEFILFTYNGSSFSFFFFFFKDSLKEAYWNIYKWNDVWDSFQKKKKNSG